MWRQQGTARMQETPIAEDVGVSSLSRRQGWRGGCTEAHTKCFQAWGTVGTGKVFVEEVSGLGRQQGLQLVYWAEKVIPGRGKSMEVGEWERNI